MSFYKNTGKYLHTFLIKQEDDYLLVIKLQMTEFKLVVSALHSLPQPLQHLQKKTHVSKRQQLRGNIFSPSCYPGKTRSCRLLPFLCLCSAAFGLF